MTNETMTREETRLAQAMAAYGIGPEHVVSSRVYPDEPTKLHPLSEPVSGVVLVTTSGKKLRWRLGETVQPLTPGERGDRIPCGGSHPEPSYSADWPGQLGERRAAEIMALVGTICPQCIHVGTKGGPNLDAYIKANSRVRHATRVLEQAKNAAAATPSPAPAPTPAQPPAGPQWRLARTLASAKEEPFDLTGV